MSIKSHQENYSIVRLLSMLLPMISILFLFSLDSDILVPENTVVYILHAAATCIICVAGSFAEVGFGDQPAEAVVVINF